jgi:hypothetical protein
MLEVLCKWSDLPSRQDLREPRPNVSALQSGCRGKAPPEKCHSRRSEISRPRERSHSMTKHAISHCLYCYACPKLGTGVAQGVGSYELNSSTQRRAALFRPNRLEFFPTPNVSEEVTACQQ